MSISSSRIAAVGLLILTAGKAPKPDYSPVMAAPATVEWRANGAIYQATSGYAPLTSGARASMVGDVLTIALVERTQATKATSQTTGRDGSIGLTPPATGIFNLFSPSDVTASGTSAFKGQGQAAQSNALSGEITVTVAAVYPNGTMRVRGEKIVTLNRGDEIVQFSGIVRDADIGSDNRVLSTRVADARITYTGKGEMARASRQGWLQRFFSRVSPF
jgi:flagellar L-ring protein FlgH